jgi:hypothetical protein
MKCTLGENFFITCFITFITDIKNGKYFILQHQVFTESFCEVKIKQLYFYFFLQQTFALIYLSNDLGESATNGRTLDTGTSFTITNE